ncbi:MAG: hypothetical protein JO104_09110 [Candidatus Eremiobacteraeota bacterium]|nr:hypothetical protein [Candidatus Eremiobacteraeota bacterium]
MTSTGEMPQVSSVAARGSIEGSWISPDAKGKPLLYVINGQITVFAFPSGSYVGTIGNYNASGVCADKSGNVFVTERAYAQIVEYAHDSLTPRATLKVTNRQPLSCSIDPNTGNLAVTIEPSTKNAGVAIFKAAKGRPKYYFYQNYNAWLRACGYDGKSNLFVETTVASKYALTELRKGGGSFQDIQIKGVAAPNNPQWDGKYVTVSSQTASDSVTVYRLTVKAKSATVAGKTALNSTQILSQTWFQSGVVVGASAEGTSLWEYPSGGDPIQTLPGTGESAGAAVSL